MLVYSVVNVFYTKESYRYFSEDVQMANKHMKRCWTSLIIREKQIKTMSYHFTHIRMVNIKIKNEDWQRCEEFGTLVYCWWECKIGCWRKLAVPQKIERKITIWLSNFTLSMYSKEFKSVSNRYLYNQVHRSIILSSQKMGEKNKCPSVSEWKTKCGMYIQWNSIQPKKI